MLGIVKHLNLGPLQHAGEIYVGLLAATILFIATNAGIIGVSRLVYSMGLHRQVPDELRQLHPRFRTPWIGIIVFGGIACLTMIPGQADFLGNMYAFGAMLSFTIAHLAVIRLRIKRPRRARPYRGPGTLRDRRARAAAVRGARRARHRFLAFVTVTALHVAVAAAGIGWLLIGDAACTSSTAAARDSTSPPPRRSRWPRPATDTEAEYESVAGRLRRAGGYSPEVLATAARLAARRRRGIHVLVTISVPSSSPIDARPARRRRQLAQSIIEEAKVQAGRRVSGHWDKVRRRSDRTADRRRGPRACTPRRS